MPNPTTKQELLATMTDGYAQLSEQIAKMSAEEIAAPFTFVSSRAITKSPTPPAWQLIS